MHQNIKVSGRRDSAKNDSESVKSDLNNFGNLVDYYGIEPREGVETLRSMFRFKDSTDSIQKSILIGYNPLC